MTPETCRVCFTPELSSSKDSSSSGVIREHWTGKRPTKALLLATDSTSTPGDEDELSSGPVWCAPNVNDDVAGLVEVS